MERDNFISAIRAVYEFTDIPIITIADVFKISRRQIFRWIKKFNWMKQEISKSGPVGDLVITKIEQLEFIEIKKALHYTNFNRRSASGLLGISERTLYRKIAKYGL